ncbi:hypothetical protein [Myroides guanonis]|uniref:Uncharacterized protein n=1 Tax=Myroides guanonis TaxID=1150112 RepID=A0A1I3S2H2_9FLAO|nr:hypothetical protein [Myroides guanonis]SFJ53063.1 hypothetical protein SAMN04487893_109109 [Myroides guanonis]
MGNTKKKGRKRLITSLKKAKEGMEILNESRDWFLLGILNVLGGIDKPILVDIFMAYPDLVEEHGIEDLHLNKVDFEGATKEEFKLANTLSVLRDLMIVVFSQFEKGILIRDGRIEIEEEEDALEMKLIEQITCLISLEEFTDRLRDIKFIVIDEVDYTIITSAFSDESFEVSVLYSMFEHDPKLRDSKNILLWFGHIIILLEIVYYIINYNSKRERG